MSWCVVLRPPAPAPSLLSAGSAVNPFAVLMSLSLSLSLVCLSLSSSLAVSFFLLSVIVVPPLLPPPTPACGLPSLPHRHPRCPSGPVPRVCLQWHPPVGRQSGRCGGAGGGPGRPAGGEAGTGAATRRGRLEKRRHCPQRARRRWQGGERPLADGAEPPGRREAQLVQVSDGPPWLPEP